jgi:hypothetical protein
MPYHGRKTSNITSQKKFKMQPPAGKMMPTLLWDSKAPILEHYIHRGTKVNIVYYRKMLWDWMRPASLTEYQGMVMKGVVLLHDNFNLHTAIHTVHTFWPTELQGVILCLVLIWPLRIITCLVHSKTLQEDAILPEIKKCKGCMHSLSANQKNIFF